jgi:hypothetical protein
MQRGREGEGFRRRAPGVRNEILTRKAIMAIPWTEVSRSSSKSTACTSRTSGRTRNDSP